MKEKIQSILRHFFTGAAALLVDAGLLDSSDASTLVQLFAAAGAIIVSRCIIWLLGQIHFLRFFSELKKGGTATLLVVGTAAAFVCGLPSCVPSHYKVDARPYLDEIKAQPSEVLVRPEHVQAVGGFQLKGDLQAEVLTDYGTIGVGKDGLHGTVLVDQRSGK